MDMHQPLLANQGQPFEVNDRQIGDKAHPLECKISTKDQIQALMSKDLIRWSRKKLTFIVSLCLGGIFGLIGGKTAIFPFLTISILGTLFGQDAVMQIVDDKSLNFRQTFKLMGLRDNSYITASFLFQFCICMCSIMSSFCVTAMVGFGGPGPFENMMHFAFFFLNTILFTGANIMFCYCFASTITDWKNAKQIATMFTGIVATIPMCFMIKSAISEWLFSQITQNPDIFNITSVQQIIRVLMYVSPHQAFFDIYQSNYIRYSIFGLNLLPTLILALQFVGYGLIFFISQNFFSFKKPSVSRIDLKGSDIDLSESLDAGQPILRVRKVTKKYGSFKAVDDVSMDIMTSRVTCILGHNGAGKTTLINCICGMTQPSQGQIFLNDKDISSSEGVLAGRVGYCTSRDVLYEDLTVSEFLTFIAILKGVKDVHQHVIQVIRKCSLQSYTSQLIKNLSGGTKRRTTIASAVIGEPEIIIMDEPSSGVDPENRRQLWALIESLKDDKTALILTTHHLEEAEYLSTDVIIMDRGKIEIRGSPYDICMKFGIGYRVTVDNIRDEQQKNFIQNNIGQILNHAKTSFSDLNFLTQGKLDFVVPLNVKNKMGDLLRFMETNGFAYNVESNTLEEAFIQLGEDTSDEKIKQEVQLRKDVFDILFSEKFQPSWIKIFLSLTFRRIALFFSSLIQILQFIYLIILPPVVMYTFGPASLTTVVLYGFTGLLLFFYLVICSFYAYLPFYERKVRLRYLLKMLGTNSTTYFINMVLTDLVIAFSIILLTGGFFIFLYWGRYDFSDMKSEYTVAIVVGFLNWKFSFITQSYFLQNLTKTTQDNVRSVPYMILASNLLYIPLFMLIAKLQINSLETIKWIFVVVSTFLPTPAYFIILAKIMIDFVLSFFPGGTGGQNPIGNELYNACRIAILTGALFYLSISILRDYYDNRLKPTNEHHETVEQALVGQHVVSGLNTIQEEARIASENRNDIPIQAASVSKVFGNTQGVSFKALNNVSVNLYRGETLGLLGPNGAGKSTLFNILSTYHTQTSGTIKVFGDVLKIDSPFFQQSGICPQDEVVWDSLTVNIHLQMIRIMKTVPEKLQEVWLKLLDMDRFDANCPAELSSGMKRKLSFIISAIFNPMYKFLDEPTTGLDPIARKRFREIIDYQKKVYGASTVFTTHTMNEAEKTCDRILILVNGNTCVLDRVENLRRMTGGYNLTVVKNDPYTVGVQIVPQLAAALDLNPERLTIVEENEFKITIDLQELTDVPNKFGGLQRLQDDGLFKDFNLNRKSLEDLFLALSRYQALRRD